MLAEESVCGASYEGAMSLVFFKYVIILRCALSNPYLCVFSIRKQSVLRVSGLSAALRWNS